MRAGRPSYGDKHRPYAAPDVALLDPTPISLAVLPQSAPLGAYAAASPTNTGSYALGPSCLSSCLCLFLTSTPIATHARSTQSRPCSTPVNTPASPRSVSLIPHLICLVSPVSHKGLPYPIGHKARILGRTQLHCSCFLFLEYYPLNSLFEVTFLSRLDHLVSSASPAQCLLPGVTPLACPVQCVSSSTPPASLLQRHPSSVTPPGALCLHLSSTQVRLAAFLPVAAVLQQFHTGHMPRVQVRLWVDSSQKGQNH